MANVRSANTYYIDGTATELAVKNLRVTHVTITPTSANAVLVLKDVTTGTIKVELRAPTSGKSEVFDYFFNPIVFANGIDPDTVTNCVATCHLQETRG